MNIVLLSGGSGQRLWPLSNEIRSKQFIKIFHKEDGELESMVQRVYRQIRTVDTDATVTIATSKSQVSAIHNQLGENVGISVEPCRRDTFPAIALAAAYLKDVQHVGEEEAVVICPVDPYVEDDYFKTIEALGNRAAESEANLVLWESNLHIQVKNMDISFQKVKKTSAKYLCLKKSQQQKWQKATFLRAHCGMAEYLRLGLVMY